MSESPSLHRFDLLPAELQACRIALDRACSPLADRLDVTFGACDAVVVEADDEGLCIATIELGEPDRRQLVQAVKALFVDLQLSEGDAGAAGVDAQLAADVITRLGGWDLT